MNEPRTPFYVTGGTLRYDAPCYVERQADRDLDRALRDGEFCYVLTARQIGKSSLMVRAAARLRREGVAVAVLDLSALGRNLSVEQWYAGLLREAASQFDLEAELPAFWRREKGLGPLQRFMTALRSVVLARHTGRVVLFIDEIDVVQGLPFPTDEFFAGIRECYNRRATEPALSRLTFCLMGVATPSDLVRDVRTTPFNIGRRIELRDFTLEEAAPLAEGLIPPPNRPARALDGANPCTVQDAPGRAFGTLLEAERGSDAIPSPLSNSGRGGRGEGLLLPRILHWTGGHPYLTQRLCRAVAEAADAAVQRATCSVQRESRPDVARCTLHVAGERAAHASAASHVDRLCQALFLTAPAREREENLLFVRDRLLGSEVDRAALLTLYERVRRGEAVADDEANPLVSVLHLSGIVRTIPGTLQAAASNRLAVRNRIYERVFDRAWVREQMPGAELRRQQAAFARGVMRAASLGGTVLAVVGALGLAAERQRRRAVRAEMEATERLWQSYLAQARALRFSRRPGQRFEALEALAKAAAIRPSLELRNEAIAAMALPDLRFSPEILSPPRDTAYVTLDAGHQRWLCADPHGNVEIRAVRDGRLLFRLPGNGSVPSLIRLSTRPDGAELALIYRSDGGQCQLWDLARRRLLLEISGVPGRFVQSEDGRWLIAVVGTAPDVWGIDVYDQRTGERTLRLPRSGTPGALALNSDGRRLAFSYLREPKVEILDWHSGAVERTIAPPAPAWGVTWHPDGNRLAFAGTDHRIHLWDLAGDERVTLMEGHEQTVLDGAFVPGSSLLVSTSWDETLRVWDYFTGREMLSWSIAPVNNDFQLGSYYHGRMIVGRQWDAGRRLRFLELDAARECRTLDTKRVPAEAPKSPSFSPDGRFLAVADDPGDGVKLWDVQEARLAATVPSGHSVVAFFDPTGERLVTHGRTGLIQWRIERDRIGGGIRAVDPEPLVALPGNGQAARSHDGRTLASIHGGEVHVIRLSNPRRRRVLQGQPGLWTVAISPDGRWLATGAYRDGEHQVRVWDLNRPGDTGQDLQWEDPFRRAHVAFSPDSRYLVTGLPHEYRLWSVGSWQTRWWIKRQDRGYYPGAAGFSPDGRLLAVARSVQTAQLLDWRTGQEVATLEVPYPRRLGGFAFSPDGRYLAATGAGNRMFLWDLLLIRRRLRAMGLDWEDGH